MLDAHHRNRGGQDSTVKLFDAISGQKLYTLAGLETGTGSIAFSPTGRALAAGGWNGQLVVWDVEVSTGLTAASTLEPSLLVPQLALTFGNSLIKVAERCEVEGVRDRRRAFPPEHKGKTHDGTDRSNVYYDEADERL